MIGFAYCDTWIVVHGEAVITWDESSSHRDNEIRVMAEGRLAVRERRAAVGVWETCQGNARHDHFCRHAEYAIGAGGAAEDIRSPVVLVGYVNSAGRLTQGRVGSFVFAKVES